MLEQQHKTAAASTLRHFHLKSTQSGELTEDWSSSMTDTAGKVFQEISRMHGSIEGWVRGVLPEQAFEAEISGHIAPQFEIVEPNGQIVTRDQAMNGLFKFRGGNPGFRITIDEAEIVFSKDETVLARYVERQTGAKLAEATNARRATCLSEVGDRVRHLHLHETWLESG